MSTETVSNGDVAVVSATKTRKPRGKTVRTDDKFSAIVFAGLVAGKSNDEIATELGMEPKSFATRLVTFRKQVTEWAKTTGNENPFDKIPSRQGRGGAGNKLDLSSVVAAAMAQLNTPAEKSAE